MRLFHAQYACSTAPYIVINELGLACDIVKTSFTDKAELLKVNPKGKVPSLVLDNGQVLTECAVVMQYLADQKPEAGILPRVGTWERYQTLEAVNFVATDIHQSLSPLFSKDISDETRTQLKVRAERGLAALNQQLAGRQFLAANQYTIADIYCFTVVSWTKVLGLDMSKYPNILGYCEKIGTRPAVIKSMAN